ncbi:MAG: ATP-dependent metallopeptidase FtsH/Yme1/Tma family protein [Bauldia sp.]
MNRLRMGAIWVIVALLIVALFNLFQSNPTSVIAERNYSQFLADVAKGAVRSVRLAGPLIAVVPTQELPYRTYAPSDPDLVQRLIDGGVTISAVPASDGQTSLLAVLVNWLPWLLFLFACVVPLWRLVRAVERIERVTGFRGAT